MSEKDIADPPIVDDEEENTVAQSDDLLRSQAVPESILESVNAVIARALGNEMFTLRGYLLPRLKEIDQELGVKTAFSYPDSLPEFDVYSGALDSLRRFVGGPHTDVMLVELRKLVNFTSVHGVSAACRIHLKAYYERFRESVYEDEKRSGKKWNKKRKLLALADTTRLESMVQDLAVGLLRHVDVFVRERQELLGIEKLRMMLDLFLPRNVTRGVDIYPRGSLFVSGD